VTNAVLTKIGRLFSTKALKANQAIKYLQVADPFEGQLEISLQTSHLTLVIVHFRCLSSE